MRLLRLDDLLMRLTVLLLPELRDGDQDQTTPATSQGGQQQLRQLMAWIDAHLDQPIGLSDLEAQSCYSRRALQDLFRKETGCTPMQWLRQRRLDRAMARLQQPEPGDSISRIAEQCGYTNLAAFSRDFAAQHKRRPSEVLRSSRIEQANTRP